MALQAWKQRARRLKRETYTLYLTTRQPDVPWYVKAVAVAVVAYALSPIDLIPDFIPMLGYRDDVILVPLGIALVIRLTPREVFANCRLRARWLAPGAYRHDCPCRDRVLRPEPASRLAASPAAPTFEAKP
jgi:uncharacterized membrane protein YkvA (DUF1232 family)